MYFRKKTSGGRAYLQIVESRREGAAVRQQVIATLGRVEDLRGIKRLGSCRCPVSTLADVPGPFKESGPGENFRPEVSRPRPFELATSTLPR